jgi:hypothetical protein
LSSKPKPNPSKKKKRESSKHETLVGGSETSRNGVGRRGDGARSKTISTENPRRGKANGSREKKKAADAREISDGGARGDEQRRARGGG